MKCPNCHHVSDTALLKCSACGEAYDHAALEMFQHLEYLLNWLSNRKAEFAPDLYARLRGEVVERLDAARAELRLPSLAAAAAALVAVPTPSVPIARTLPPAVEAPSPPAPTLPPARPVEEIARELALVEAALAQVQSWLEANALYLLPAQHLRRYLTVQAENLKAELAGRPAVVGPPTELQVVEFALQSLPAWSIFINAAYLEKYLKQKRAKLTSPRPVPQAVAKAPSPAPTPVTALSPIVVPAPKPVPVVAPSLPKAIPPAKPATPPAPPIDWGKAWERAWGFVVSGALLRGLLYLGAFMIVVAAVVLVVVYWQLFPLPLQIGFVAALPLSFYGSGFALRNRLKIPVAGGVFTGIGALLLAVDFAAVYQLAGLRGRVDVDFYWLAASLVCLVAYLFTASRVGGEFFSYITLITFSSGVLSLTRVLHLSAEWNVASVSASAVGMVAGAVLMKRAPARGGDLSRAARRLPQLLFPVTIFLAFVLIFYVAADTSLSQAAIFVFAALGYGLLAWQFPATMFAYAAVLSSIGAVGFGLRAAALPGEWYAAAAASISCLYLLAGRWMSGRLRPDFVPRRAYLNAVYVAGFGLVAVAIFAGLISLDIDLWAGVIALTVASLVLAWCAYLFRRPEFVVLSAGLCIGPFSLAVERWLLDFRVFQWGAWLMAGEAGLALAYLGLAVLLRPAEKYGRWLNLWAHGLAPLALFGLLLNYGFTTPHWFDVPTLAALGGVLLVYLASAVIHDSGRHPALSKFVSWLPPALHRAIFLWPIGALLPVWMAIAWWGSVLQPEWLGAALAGLALAYVGLGQVLARRQVVYRFPPHVYAYLLAVLGAIVAFEQTRALMATLYIVVVVLVALAFVYRRVAETALAALLFLWPFQLSLQLSPLTPHAHALAYALLASLGYLPVGLVLRKAGRKFALPEYVIGYAVSACAVGASLLGRFGAYPLDVPWVGVAVPLVVTGLQVFSVYRFRRSPFAWAAALIFPIAFGQTLTLLRVRPEYDATAWIGLAFAYMLAERTLSPSPVRRDDEQERGPGGEVWPRLLRWPLGIGAPILAALGLALTAPATLLAFAGFKIENYFPLILAQMLAAVFTVFAARQYQSHWPLYLEPPLAFVPVTLFFVGYSVRLFVQPLTSPQFGIVWSGLGAAHLLTAILLDRAKARYAHGLYLGGYALLLFAILWSLFDRAALLWTLGLGIVVATGSAALVHFNRHHAWDEFVALLFGKTTNTLRGVTRGAFLWFAAWPFPIWCVLLLRQLRVADSFYWLGLGLSALLLLGLAVWLRRIERTYAWPLHTAAQFFTAVGLLISAPLTLSLLAGQSTLPLPLLSGLRASGFIVLQTVAVVFYAASARAFRWRFFAHIAAWLSFFPYTLAWLIYGSGLSSAQFAWVWTGWAVVLLLVGFTLDRLSVRYAHGPYLAGYALGLFALVWSVSDRLTNLYTLPVVILLALASHALVHYGQHRSFDDFIRLIWRMPGTAPQRAARTAFLFFAAYAFPFWLMQLLAYFDVPLAWRGLALAMMAPIYIAFGLAARRTKARGDLPLASTWPLYSAGYALTSIGAMVAFGNEALAIYVLALDAVVYATSAYIFRQSFWLYLSNALVPVIVLLTLHHVQSLSAPWVAGIFVDLAFLYFLIGQWFDWRKLPSPVARPERSGAQSKDTTGEGRGVGSFALAFYAPGYVLSAVALAVATGEKLLAIEVFSAGAVLYALSAWAFDESIFLYPAAWLVAVPYYLGMTLTALPSQWYGLGWLPLIVGYIALGRIAFHQRPLGLSLPSRSLIPRLKHALTHPAMPVYLLAYALSVSMMVLSQSGGIVLALAFMAGAIIYLGSAVIFRRAAWVYPGLLAAHLALLAYLNTLSGGRPYYASLPFHALTWLIALTGYAFTRLFPVARKSETGKSIFKFGIWNLEFEISPGLGHLITPSWAQPFFLFTALDVILWQIVALGGYDTTFILAAGHMLLFGLLATAWQDTPLAYGTVGFLLLAVGSQLRRVGMPFAGMMASFGGIGFGLYLLSRIAGRARWTALVVWVKSLTNAALFLTALAVLLTLPTVVTTTTASATALAFAGALYLAIAYRGRFYRLGYAGIAMLQLAWALALVVRDVSQPQWYAIPAGLYFTGVGFLERRRSRHLFAVVIESFGLAVLLLTAFIQSLNGAAGFPYFLLLLVEALLVIWWGAARRLKVPFFIGLGASALNVVAQVVVLVNVYDVNRWIIILGVGLLLVTVAVFVERQRELLIAKAQEWREALEKWE